jgi:hypothetical protein
MKNKTKKKTNPGFEIYKEQKTPPEIRLAELIGPLFA